MATKTVELFGSLLNSGVTPQTVYTSPTNGAGTRISSINVYNTDTVTQGYTIYVVSNATLATDTNIVAKHQLLAGESDTPFEVVNITIPPGGTIQIAGTTASKIAFRGSGLEIAS